MNKKRNKRIAITGLQGQRQITAVICGSMMGKILFHGLSTKERLEDVTQRSPFQMTGLFHTVSTIGPMWRL